MAFLSIGDGVTTITVDVSADGARELEPDRAGDRSRAFSGVWRIDTTAEFRRFEFLVPRLTEADFEALRAMVARDRLRNVAGDAIGAAIRATVRLTEVPYLDDVSDPATGYFTRACTLLVEEG